VGGVPPFVFIILVGVVAVFGIFMRLAMPGGRSRSVFLLVRLAIAVITLVTIAILWLMRGQFGP
jgi:hypothetical protein